MSAPVTVTFHGMMPNETLEHDIRARAAKLERYCGDIQSCRVAVDLPHLHHEGGNRFSVRIEINVPGETLAVSRDATLHGAKADLGEAEWVKQFEVEGMRKHRRLVVREAFDVARRRLQDYVRRRRLAVKAHTEPLRGFVVEWNPVDEFGRIEAADGHEVYFHQHSVVGGLRRLRNGVEVVFVEEAGEKGAQASTVRVRA